METTTAEPEAKSNDKTSPGGLACVLCQTRKVKCDRGAPCSNCVKRGVKCIPGTAVPLRQRRRRFPERDLLDKLRSYESLLKKHKIHFEPLHQGISVPLRTRARGKPRTKESDTERSGSSSHSPAAETSPGPNFKTKSLWDVMRDKATPSDDDDDGSDQTESEYLEENDIRVILAQAHSEVNSILPFGRPKIPIDLSDRHPDQVTIFKLWQIYLDNVNPLLKLTHTSTFQPRLIAAAGNVASISPSMTALMFSIYCVAVTSIDEQQCQALFGVGKESISIDFQMSCQQALSNCGILSTREMDSLTALYLFLLAIEKITDQPSLYSLLSIEVRLAKRMRIHDEAVNSKFPVLEAELRRRLWWAIVLFDTRVGELAGHNDTLRPSWDCRPPSNLNDFELSQDMHEMPKAQDMPSEAIFAVVRAEIAQFVRHSGTYMEFSGPGFKSVLKSIPTTPTLDEQDYVALGDMLEDRFLSKCNPENAIHFMTIWMSRAFHAKFSLLNHYSNLARSTKQQTDVEKDISLRGATRMLECDAILWNNPMLKPWHWYLTIFYPLPAFFHIMDDLKKRPTSTWSSDAWQAMSDRYDAQEMFQEEVYDQIFKVFAKKLSQAWQARLLSGISLEPFPNIITKVSYKASEMLLKQNLVLSTATTQESFTNLATSDFWSSFDAQNISTDYPLDMTSTLDMGAMGHSILVPSVEEPAVNWSGLDWSSMQGNTW